MNALISHNSQSHLLKSQFLPHLSPAHHRSRRGNRKKLYFLPSGVKQLNTTCLAQLRYRRSDPDIFLLNLQHRSVWQDHLH